MFGIIVSISAMQCYDPTMQTTYLHSPTNEEKGWSQTGECVSLSAWTHAIIGLWPPLKFKFSIPISIIFETLPHVGDFKPFYIQYMMFS